MPIYRLILASCFSTWNIAHVFAVNGGTSDYSPFTYTSGLSSSTLGGIVQGPLKSSNYEYTGMGAAESTIDIASDGSLIYSPALTTAGTGYAQSYDNGKSWTQVLPGGASQPRIQPIFTIRDGRFFFWSSNPPGLMFEYSDNLGKTFSPPLNSSHFDYEIQDWAKLVAGNPVSSRLSNQAKQILYLSAPAFISTPLPVQPLGPEFQRIMKSTDNGNTWTSTAGTPTLQPILSGGACSGLVRTLADQELIIWGDGFVMPNGTVVYGLRRCQKLSLAFSHDEGDSWELIDVPGSSLVPFFPGDLTYLFDGNVLVPNSISQAPDGTIYSIWVDADYVLKMSRSRDGRLWSTPIVIGAPGSLPGSNSMAYLPIMRINPNNPARAAIAYYSSKDGGKTYNAYVAETDNIAATYPSWSSLILNRSNEPMQMNQDGAWDQGYGDPLYDLVEFTGLQYTSNGSLVTAFARSMCSGPSQPPQTYPQNTCVSGWKYAAQGNSRWQGFVGFARH